MKTIKPIKKNLLRAAALKGFSLVELLVVIAVIGIIAAIAIPSISGITGKAGVAKDQRNAQNLASTFSAARAAGADQAFTDKADAANAIIAGNITFPTSSQYTGANFKVASMSDADRDAALPYLNLSTGNTTTNQLEYNSAGAPAPTP